MSPLLFLVEDPLTFQQIRQLIDNIMDWGMNERLDDIKAALTMYIGAQTEVAKEDAL